MKRVAVLAIAILRLDEQEDSLRLCDVGARDFQIISVERCLPVRRNCDKTQE